MRQSDPDNHGSAKRAAIVLAVAVPAVVAGVVFAKQPWAVLAVQLVLAGATCLGLLAAVARRPAWAQPIERHGVTAALVLMVLGAAGVLLLAPGSNLLVDALLASSGLLLGFLCAAAILTKHGLVSAGFWQPRMSAGTGTSTKPVVLSLLLLAGVGIASLVVIGKHAAIGFAPTAAVAVILLVGLAGWRYWRGRRD